MFLSRSLLLFVCVVVTTSLHAGPDRTGLNNEDLADLYELDMDESKDSAAAGPAESRRRSADQELTRDLPKRLRPAAGEQGAAAAAASDTPALAQPGLAGPVLLVTALATASAGAGSSSVPARIGTSPAAAAVLGLAGLQSLWRYLWPGPRFVSTEVPHSSAARPVAPDAWGLVFDFLVDPRDGLADDAKNLGRVCKAANSRLHVQLARGRSVFITIPPDPPQSFEKTLSEFFTGPDWPYWQVKREKLERFQVETLRQKLQAIGTAREEGRAPQRVKRLVLKDSAHLTKPALEFLLAAFSGLEELTLAAKPNAIAVLKEAFETGSPHVQHLVALNWENSSAEERTEADHMLLDSLDAGILPPNLVLLGSEFIDPDLERLDHDPGVLNQARIILALRTDPRKSDFLGRLLNEILGDELASLEQRNFALRGLRCLDTEERNWREASLGIPESAAPALREFGMRATVRRILDAERPELGQYQRKFVSWLLEKEPKLSDPSEGEHFVSALTLLRLRGVIPEATLSAQLALRRLGDAVWDQDRRLVGQRAFLLAHHVYRMKQHKEEVTGLDVRATFQILLQGLESGELYPGERVWIGVLLAVLTRDPSFLRTDASWFFAPPDRLVEPADRQRVLVQLKRVLDADRELASQRPVGAAAAASAPLAESTASSVAVENTGITPQERELIESIIYKLGEKDSSREATP